MKHRDEVIVKPYGPGGVGWKTWRFLFFYRWWAWTGENASVQGYRREGGFALSRRNAIIAARRSIGDLT